MSHNFALPLRRALLVAVALIDTAVAANVAPTNGRMVNPDGVYPGSASQLLTRQGGRVSWYHGAAHQLIAFDAITNPQTRDMDIFTIDPATGDRRCVTCQLTNLPQGMRGLAAWHPDGAHLLVTAENAHSGHTRFNHPSWAVDNDLWVVSLDGRRVEKLWAAPAAGHAILHARLTPDGRKLVFAERQLTGRKLPRRLRGLGSYGENIWEGWSLYIADVDWARPGTGKLSNHHRLQPNGRGFYEPGDYLADGRLTYSFTARGQAYCDDIFVARDDGTGAVNLLRNPRTWDEHPHFSPNHKLLAYISSRFDSGLSYPRAKARDLRTEIYVRLENGSAFRVTDSQSVFSGKTVASQFSWSPDGQRIVYQIASLTKPAEPQLWIVTLPDNLTAAVSP